MEFVFVIIVGVVGFLIGWKVREYIALQVLEKMFESFEESALTDIRKNIINITVEEHEGEFFIYKRDDGSYIAHGKNLNVLEEILKEKFPGKTFNASAEDLNKLEQ